MVVLPVMPTLRRLRKEDDEFEARLHTNFDASLGHMKPCCLTTERRWEAGEKRKVRCSSQTVSDRLVSHRCNVPGCWLSHPNPRIVSTDCAPLSFSRASVQLLKNPPFYRTAGLSP